jgi:hypothetical protein
VLASELSQKALANEDHRTSGAATRSPAVFPIWEHCRRIRTMMSSRGLALFEGPGEQDAQHPVAGRDLPATLHLADPRPAGPRRYPRIAPHVLW